MSIRLRLTLLYSAILALTLMVLGVVLVVTVSQVTLDTLQRDLRTEAERATYVRDPRLERFGFDPRRLSLPKTFMQALDADGQILARTTNLGDFNLPVNAAALQAALANTPTSIIEPTDTGRLLVYYQPIQVHGQTTGVLQMARSLAEMDSSVATLQSALLIGSAVVSVLAFLVGWFLSGTALRPIHRITDTARVIGHTRDFDRRVTYAGPPDEVGQLATTFNGMLTELQAAYRQAEQSAQAQRRLVADASHELRTPLTTIRGNLGLLRRQPPISAEDTAAAVSDMVDETERLIRLVNDLLVLARSDAGRPLRLAAVPLRPLLDDVYRQARLLSAERSLRCEDVPAVAVWADRDAVKQVLLILLDNALKYTPIDGTITIAAAVTAGGAAITLRDTGPGIAPAAVPHIFERFYRSDESRAGSGAGLGLAIAKELMDAQQGQIDVSSEVGRGSAFTVTLPLAPEN